MGVDITFGEILVAVSLGLFFTAIPLAPGGIGTTHLAFGYFFSLFGVKFE